LFGPEGIQQQHDHDFEASNQGLVRKPWPFWTEEEGTNQAARGKGKLILLHFTSSGEKHVGFFLNLMLECIL
jgi:hypothetical protein